MTNIVTVEYGVPGKVTKERSFGFETELEAILFGELIGLLVNELGSGQKIEVIDFCLTEMTLITSGTEFHDLAREMIDEIAKAEAAT